MRHRVLEQTPYSLRSLVADNAVLFGSPTFLAPPACASHGRRTSKKSLTLPFMSRYLPVPAPFAVVTIFWASSNDSQFVPLCPVIMQSVAPSQRTIPRRTSMTFPDLVSLTLFRGRLQLGHSSPSQPGSQGTQSSSSESARKAWTIRLQPSLWEMLKRVGECSEFNGRTVLVYSD